MPGFMAGTWLDRLWPARAGRAACHAVGIAEALLWTPPALDPAAPTKWGAAGVSSGRAPTSLLMAGQATWRCIPQRTPTSPTAQHADGPIRATSPPAGVCLDGPRLPVVGSAGRMVVRAVDAAKPCRVHLPGDGSCRQHPHDGPLSLDHEPGHASTSRHTSRTLRPVR